MDRLARINAVVATFTKREVNAGESLFDSGLLDSFALPDLVAALEGEFHIQIPDKDLNPRVFDTISRIDSYMATKV